MSGWAKIWPFAGSRARRDAEALVVAVSAMARRPAFFGEARAPDTLEGRFEVLALHAALVFMRLQREPALAPLAQAFADGLFSRIDSGLREAGVGDLTVPKKMRRLAGAFYGRLEVYAAAIAAGDDSALAAALARNIPVGPSFAATLAAWAAAQARAQAELTPAALQKPDAWGDLSA